MTLLGQNTPVPEQYAPEVLSPIPRSEARAGLGLGEELPFVGEDVWHAWELSWLDAGAAPQVAVARLGFPCSSPSLVESKSLKLYFNSLNQARFDSEAELRQTLEQDLGRVAGGPVTVEILAVDSAQLAPGELPGTCIDGEAIEGSDGAPQPELLRAEVGSGEQVLHSHVLRSLCPVTAQPDWASVVVHCTGSHIVPASLLSYLHGFRTHQEFHEQCVERIFCDIQRACAPQDLSVQALYTRRGGLDISPWRSTSTASAPRLRSLRQ